MKSKDGKAIDCANHIKPEISFWVMNLKKAIIYPAATTKNTGAIISLKVDIIFNNKSKYRLLNHHGMV